MIENLSQNSKELGQDVLPIRIKSTVSEIKHTLRVAADTS